MAERIVPGGMAAIVDEDTGRPLGYRDTAGRNWFVPGWATDANGNAVGMVWPSGNVATLQRSLTEFGPVGTAAQDTSTWTAALAWLQTAALSNGNARLVVPGGLYRITGTLALPDASGWALEPHGQVTLEQQTSNVPTLRMRVSVARSRFALGGYGGVLAFAWASNQPASNTSAIGIAFGSTVEVVDGIYDFRITNVIGNGGYRLVSIDPLLVTNNWRFPIWGYVIDGITGYRQMTGGTLVLFSPNPNVGMPRAEIRNFYAQGESATEHRLRIDGVAQLRIGNAEFNLGTGRQALFQNCRQILIDNLRLEQASSVSNFEKIFVFAASFMQAIIRNLEIQSHTVNVANNVYLIDSDSGSVSVENITVRDVTTTSGGLYLLNSSAGGVVQYGGDVSLTNAGDTFLCDSTAAPNVTPRALTTVTFARSALTANMSFVEVEHGAVGGGYVVQSPCYLVGLVVRLSNAVTAGQLQVFAYNNGAVMIGSQFAVTITSGQSGVRYHPAWTAFRPSNDRQGHRLVAGDQLSMRVTTDASFAATGGTVRVTAILAPVPR